MAIRTGIIFCTLLLGSLAIPVPEEDVDMSIFFDFVSEPVDERIVGGSTASIGNHPWMVAFTTGGVVRSAHCGASILSSRTVLTAAHCIVPVRVGNSVNANVRVSVGTARVNSGGQTLTISAAHIHASYNANTIKNDVGTMITASNINFGTNVRAIPLATDWAGGNIQSRVAGWGRTAVNQAASVTLLELALPTLDANRCVWEVQQASVSLNIRAPPVDPNLEICTFHSRGRGTCHGDSGSALVRWDRRQQIGIVSWGFPCALGAPDMYARVSTYAAWIRQHTQF